MDRVARLRTNYLENPLGFDDPKPQFSWTLESDRADAKQTHYQILVASSQAKLDSEDGDLWNSGKVSSDQQRWIVYEGATIPSKTRAYWKVRVWDDSTEYGPSDPSFWETGPGDWSAKWIGGMLAGGPRTTAPPARVRKTFNVGKPVREARLFITALGLYDGNLNGKPVGNWKLGPGWTHYAKQVRYQAYDVTDSLQSGENVLEVDLGDGWYCGHVEWRGRQLYGDRPKLLAQLHLFHEDGSETLVPTDESWEHAYGPTLEGDALMGESYDARRAYEDWMPVKTFSAPTGLKITPTEGPANTVTEEIKPIEVKEQPGWPGPKWIFDMGQNMVGHVRLKVAAPEGRTIALRFGEVLDKDGKLYITNLRSAKQTDYFTASGKGTEVWEPHFTFHGFRYVETVGIPDKPDTDAITGVVVHSDTERVGWFECSDPLINQLVSNIDWGWRGNSVDVPTDCPQRDERLGWTGDAQVFIRTATYFRDVNGFFAKYVQDLADSQEPSGSIPPTAPNTNAVGGDGGPAWSDAFMICPWWLYRSYGDTAVLAKHYDGYKEFIKFLGTTAKDHIRIYDGFEGFKGFGDWLSIKAETPVDLIGTAYYAYSVEILSKIARILGHEEDAKTYEQLHEEIRAAFVAKYIDADGKVATGSQTSQVLALHFGLMPEALKGKAVDILTKDIEERDGHLSTGFVGSSYLPYVLSQNGRADVAYRLLHQETWPSWLYAVTKGATTIWERWDGWTEENGFQDPGMNSFNHYAYGAVGEWLFSTVAGIDLDPEVPAFKRIRLAAIPGGKLTWARAKFNSPYGAIESNWEIKDGTFFWDIAIPPNSNAVVSIPAGCEELQSEGSSVSHQEPFGVGSGRYRFTGRYRT
jgi:alpha-L-rhamnosidase